MCLWLDAATKDKIPSYSDHYVGVGGVVINEKDEVLLIQEQRSKEQKLWKFPGGFMDPGETLKEASEREVYEETGIKTQFIGLLSLRELLQFRYGATDFYIVSLMKPTEGCDINILDKREVAAAEWVHISELSHNDEGAKYKLFPNAHHFLRELYKMYMRN